MFARRALSAAVALAMSGAALAEVDGWSYSGEGGRSEAMQSSYFNLNDAYNIWVNPGLVTKYSNRVDVNAWEDGDTETTGDTGETAGGGFKNFGAQTFGAYIGRPSDSLLGFASTTSTFDTLEDFSATGQTGEATPATEDVDDPSNQFDLFWGMDTPAVGVGVRLNYQAIEDEYKYPTSTTTTPNAVTAPYTGALVTDTVRSNSAETSARELNVAVGLSGTNGIWDAALLFGSPSADSKTALSDTRVTQTYAAGTITDVDTDTFDGTQKISDDGASNLGLTGRLHNLWIPDSIIALQIQRQDSSYKSRIEGVSRSRTDTGNDGTIDADTSLIFTEKGTATFEVSSWSLFLTKNYAPVPGNLVLATIGLMDTDWTWRTKDTVTDHRVVDNLTGTVLNNNPAGGPYLGTQTNTKTEFEMFAIPLVVAFEGAMTANTTARAAISKNLYQSQTTTETTEIWDLPDNTPPPTGTTATEQIRVEKRRDKETHVWNTPTTLSIGAGYKDGGLGVDAVLEKEFATQGTDEGLVSRINVTWQMP